MPECYLLLYHKAQRAWRFGRAATADLLVTAVNGEGSKSRQKANKKAIDRQAFLSTWEAHTGKLVRTQDVGKRPITAIDLAASGRLLAVACSDLRVGVYDVESLQVRSKSYAQLVLNIYSPCFRLLLSIRFPSQRSDSALVALCWSPAALTTLYPWSRLMRLECEMFAGIRYGCWLYLHVC